MVSLCAYDNTNMGINNMAILPEELAELFMVYIMVSLEVRNGDNDL